MFKDCIREDIKSYYFIAKKNSITDFENYLNFCKKIKIPFKEVRPNDLDFKISNVEGGILTNEGCIINKPLNEIKDKTTGLFTDTRYYNNERVVS